MSNLLAELDDRLQQLQARVDQLQDEEVKTQNISRLREYQRFRVLAISLINTELMTYPADSGPAHSAGNGGPAASRHAPRYSRVRPLDVDRYSISKPTGTQAQGDQFTLQMIQDPPGAQTLCTWDVNRQWDFPLQDKLRNDHGELLMTTLADALEKVAATGSQASQFIGTFPDWVMTPIYSVPLDQPFEAPIASKLGATPVIASCSVIGCRLPTSGEGYWQLAISSQPHVVRNVSSSLCLDVKNNAVAPYAQLVLWPCNGTPTQMWEKRASANGSWSLASAGSAFCLTVPLDDPVRPAHPGIIPLGPGSIGVSSRVIRRQKFVMLASCDGNPRQKFANTDSTGPPRGPN